LEYEAGKLNYETAKKSLIKDVKKSFYNLIVLNESISIMERNIETAKRRFDQAKLNFENGLASEFQMLSAQVALANMKPALEDMKIGYLGAELAFKQTLGIDDDNEIEIDGSIEPSLIQLKGAKELIQGFLSNRLDIQLLRKNLDILKNSKSGIVTQSLSPSLTLMYNMDPIFMNDPFAGGWFDDVENDWVQRSGMFALTISMPLDGFIPGSKTWVDLQNMDDSIKNLEKTLEQAVQGARIDITTTLLKLNKSAQTLDSLKLNVRLAEKAYALAEQGYETGARDLIEVENAEDELQTAKLEVLKENYNYMAGLLDLEYALNTSLEEIK
jgi:outer membrane protein TolC